MFNPNWIFALLIKYQHINRYRWFKMFFILISVMCGLKFDQKEVKNFIDDVFKGLVLSKTHGYAANYQRWVRTTNKQLSKFLLVLLQILPNINVFLGIEAKLEIISYVICMMWSYLSTRLPSAISSGGRQGHHDRWLRWGGKGIIKFSGHCDQRHQEEALGHRNKRELHQAPTDGPISCSR